ncbi:transglutaminase family protein [Tabrizicola sp.]|jgi:transglutaminase-like putative cysteine protease|uniref:transglutaminase family protein n=1 Tax=Tabrizicola sp. TaxID=2005166 RepID=UPI000BCEFDB4|nr:transglutaminase family protein [Tabrizicola sp.]MBY0350924.1 transglutaminase family protein [Tabrizicola sp.]MDK2775137.1 transglutaminase family protein [Tabrizicola sp.]OYX21587.1 MAG: transglutaminase [Rhodobacterales bacterium 32-66-9]
MRLMVDHLTLYRYDAPVRSIVQSHRLTPSIFAGQAVIDWEVTVSGGVEGARHRDGAGDEVRGWTIAGPVTEVAVQVRGTVETMDLSGVLRGHRESVAADCYLRDTAPTRIDPALAALGESASGADMLSLAHALSAAVSGAIAYRPGVTHAHTTAAEALALGEGVCQDHAHALIACARYRGIPARYVSGYLFATEDGTMHEAAHAWAELHVAALGWVGFDPANRCSPDARYIRLGSGFDAQDAAPIRGIARGGATEAMDVTVAILQSAQ